MSYGLQYRKTVIIWHVQRRYVAQIPGVSFDAIPLENCNLVWELEAPDVALDEESEPCCSLYEDQKRHYTPDDEEYYYIC